MKIINRFQIKKEGDLLYSKLEIRNFLKHHKPEYAENFVFAVMELGTNILKHAKEGEIWLLGEENEYMIAALDKGEGIKDLNWALKEGNSTSNTLGIGLSSLQKIEGFCISILSLKDKIYKGTAVLFRPKKLKSSYVILQRNFMDLQYGGDFFYKKGKFFIIGDVNGHGIKARKSAERIIEFFKSRAISCVVIDDIFNDLHGFIKNNDLRGVVLSIVEKTKFISVCGIGNIKIFVKRLKNVEIYSQNEGIVGEFFSSYTKYVFDVKNALIGAFTDGIEEKVVKEVFSLNDDIYLCAVSSVFFSNIQDDKTILIFKEEK